MAGHKKLFTFWITLLILGTGSGHLKFSGAISRRTSNTPPDLTSIIGKTKPFFPEEVPSEPIQLKYSAHKSSFDVTPESVLEDSFVSNNKIWSNIDAEVGSAREKKQDVIMKNEEVTIVRVSESQPPAQAVEMKVNKNISNSDSKASNTKDRLIPQEDTVSGRVLFHSGAGGYGGYGQGQPAGGIYEGSTIGCTIGCQPPPPPPPPCITTGFTSCCSGGSGNGFLPTYGWGPGHHGDQGPHSHVGTPGTGGWAHGGYSSYSGTGTGGRTYNYNYNYPGHQATGYQYPPTTKPGSCYQADPIIGPSYSAYSNPNWGRPYNNNPKAGYSYQRSAIHKHLDDDADESRDVKVVSSEVEIFPRSRFNIRSTGSQESQQVPSPSFQHQVYHSAVPFYSSSSYGAGSSGGGGYGYYGGSGGSGYSAAGYSGGGGYTSTGGYSTVVPSGLFSKGHHQHHHGGVTGRGIQSHYHPGTSYSYGIPPGTGNGFAVGGNGIIVGTTTTFKPYCALDIDCPGNQKCCGRICSSPIFLRK